MVRFVLETSCATILLSIHVGLHPVIFIWSFRFSGKRKKPEKVAFHKALCRFYKLARILPKDV